MKDALAKIITGKAQVYAGQVTNAVDVAQAVMEYKPDGKVTLEEIVHAWETCCQDREELKTEDVGEALDLGLGHIASKDDVYSYDADDEEVPI